jgi:Resolvase, N terminal domain
MTIKRTKTRHSTARAKRRLRPLRRRSRKRENPDAGEITPKPMLLGYARVSTVDENLALQRDALTEAGCTNIFTEQMSGAVTDRPALHGALEFARSGVPASPAHLAERCRCCGGIAAKGSDARCVGHSPALSRALAASGVPRC